MISRSGTLTYEAVWQLTSLGLGQTTCVGLGGDPIVGTSFIDCLKLFKADDETEGDPDDGRDRRHGRGRGGRLHQEHVTKPVAAFIAGRTAPPGKRMGHAGAIISGGQGDRRREDRRAQGRAKKPRAAIRSCNHRESVVGPTPRAVNFLFRPPFIAERQKHSWLPSRGEDERPAEMGPRFPAAAAERCVRGAALLGKLVVAARLTRIGLRQPAGERSDTG